MIRLTLRAQQHNAPPEWVGRWCSRSAYSQFERGGRGVRSILATAPAVGGVRAQGHKEVGWSIPQSNSGLFIAKGPVAPRILVVDDEPMVCLLITRVLKDEGYEVTAVPNGRAGLEAAQTAQPAFDLVVTNTWMRGLSGAELIARLRLDFPTVPILHVDDLARHKTFAEFPEDVMTLYKPFSINALKKAVAELLGVS